MTEKHLVKLVKELDNIIYGMIMGRYPKDLLMLHDITSAIIRAFDEPESKVPPRPEPMPTDCLLLDCLNK